MENLKEKIELIDKIAQYHPGSEVGHKRGWSTYTGGMKDSGEWFTWKMLDVPMQELLEGWAEIVLEFEDTEYAELTEEEKRDLNTMTFHKNGSVSNVYFDKLFDKARQKFEQDLMWGSSSYEIKSRS